MKAAYAGIDLLFPALPALAEAGCEIVRVFTCETDNVTEFNTQVCDYALSRGIPLQTTRVTPADLEALAAQGCELLLCGGYYFRLPVRRDLYMVNIHPALLPVGRGAWPMPVTILRGHAWSGVTFHKITPGMDEDDVLLQRRVPVAPDDDLQTLTERLRAPLRGMVGELIHSLPELWQSAVPQDAALAEYWPCPQEPDWTVREGMPPSDIDRILRAFYGYEVLYDRGDERWELIGARLAGAPEAGWFSLPCGDRFINAKRARRIA